MFYWSPLSNLKKCSFICSILRYICNRLYFDVFLVEQSEGEAPALLDGMGRVTYEQSGETFFLPFGLEDIELTGQRLQAGDKVEFFISTDEK